MVPAARKTPARATGAQDAKPARPVVLLVEEHPNIRKATETVLVKAGYEVMVAAWSAEGMQILERDGARVNLLLVDLTVSAVRGRSLIARARKVQKTMPVVAMSTRTADRATQELIAFEKLPCLWKPFSADDLLKTVGETLRA